MEIAGINQLSKEQLQKNFGEGGEIIRDPIGNPTGILVERSQSLVSKFIPAQTPETLSKAYELAMERLNKQSAPAKITAAQKKELAELDSRYAAKIAEREIFLKGELAQAAAKGDAEAYVQLEKQLVSERRKFQSELEEKKEKVRAGEK